MEQENTKMLYHYTCRCGNTSFSLYHLEEFEKTCELCGTRITATAYRRYDDEDYKYNPLDKVEFSKQFRNRYSCLCGKERGKINYKTMCTKCMSYVEYLDPAESIKPTFILSIDGAGMKDITDYLAESGSDAFITLKINLDSLRFIKRHGDANYQVPANFDRNMRGYLDQIESINKNPDKIHVRYVFTDINLDLIKILNEREYNFTVVLPDGDMRYELAGRIAEELADNEFKYDVGIGKLIDYTRIGILLNNYNFIMTNYQDDSKFVKEIQSKKGKLIRLKRGEKLWDLLKEGVLI